MTVKHYLLFIIICDTSTSLEKVKTKSIKIGNITIFPVNSVRNIGAMFDSEMKMEVQVKRVCSSAWYQLYSITKIRQCITTHLFLFCFFNLF